MIKKLIFLLILTLLISTTYVESLQIGFGWTLDTGLHIRVNKFELQGVFGEPSIYGLRFYPINKGVNIIGKEFNFYSGVEANYVSSEVLDWGYTAGIFAGLDKAIFKKLHLSLDLGVFFSTVKGWEEFSDWGAAINTKLTWYIGGKK